MKATVSMIAAIGILSIVPRAAAAVPADGAAIARLAQQVDAVVVVKKAKKPKTKTSGAPTSPPPEPQRSY